MPDALLTQDAQRKLDLGDSVSEKITAFAKLLRVDSEMNRSESIESIRHNWKMAGKLSIPELIIPSSYDDGELCIALKAMETLGRVTEDLGLCLSLVAHAFVCAFPIYLAGSLNQRMSVLSQMRSGHLLGAGAMTEDVSGSDAFAMQTAATRDGDSYVLNGEKRFVTNGRSADILLVYARTRSERGPLSVSAFLVMRDAPGVDIQPEPEKSALRSADWARLLLRGCRVPAYAMIGAEGGGGSLFLEAMKWERMALAAAQVGAMQASLARCIEFSKSRHRFGKALSTFQTLSHQIVDMRVRLETCRALLDSVAHAYRATSLPEDQVAIVKLAVSEAAFQNGYAEARLHGAEGAMLNSRASALIHSALALQTASGTLEIQKELIAHRMGLMT